MSTQHEIATELAALNVDLPLLGMPHMVVPDGFFEKLGDEILAKIENRSFLDKLPRKLPYSAPNAYFEQLSDAVQSSINTEQFLASLPEKSPFSLPNDYFENFQQQLSDTIQTTDFLSTLPKKFPYAVSDSYFMEFAEKIMDKTAYVKPISPLRATRSFYSRMSVAASLIIILGISFFLMTYGSASGSIENQLAQVPDAEIDAYMEKHAYEFDHHLSYQHIDESKIDINKLESDIYNDYFKSISEEEINNFL